MPYDEKQPDQSPPSPGVKVSAIPGATADFGATGPSLDKFYTESIGRGDACIPAGQVPDVGDYVDDDVSRPDGPLFDGPQAYPSAKLHSGVDAEK